MAGAFQESEIIDPAFFYDLAFYSRQFIRHLKENIHIPFGVFVELSVNGKRTAIHTILATF